MMRHPTPGEKLAVLIHVVFGALLASFTPQDMPLRFQVVLFIALFIANAGRLAGYWLSVGIDTLRVFLDERYEHAPNTRTR